MQKRQKSVHWKSPESRKLSVYALNPPFHMCRPLDNIERKPLPLFLTVIMLHSDLLNDLESVLSHWRAEITPVNQHWFQGSHINLLLQHSGPIPIQKCQHHRNGMRIERSLKRLPWSFDEYKRKWWLLWVVMVTKNVSEARKYVTP